MRNPVQPLATVFLVIFLFAGSEGVPVKTIKSIKMSVVPIICGIAMPGRGLQVVRVMGSGFLINRRGDFITAAHVMNEWAKVSTRVRPCSPYVYFPLGGWGLGAQGVGLQSSARIRWFVFGSCASDLRIDVAACHMFANPFQEPELKKQIAPVKFLATQLADGSPVAFTGFPLSSLRPITSKGFVASYRDDASYNLPEVVIDKAAWPGASGSPLYTRHGNVIGMIREAGIYQGAGLAYARVSTLITTFLKNRKIPFTEVQKP